MLTILPAPLMITLIGHLEGGLHWPSPSCRHSEQILSAMSARLLVQASTDSHGRFTRDKDALLPSRSTWSLSFLPQDIQCCTTWLHFPSSDFIFLWAHVGSEASPPGRHLWPLLKDWPICDWCYVG